MKAYWILRALRIALFVGIAAAGPIDLTSGIPKTVAELERACAA